MQVVKWMDRAMQKARRPDGSWVPTAHGGQQAGYGAPGVASLVAWADTGAASILPTCALVAACSTAAQLASLWQQDLA